MSSSAWRVMTGGAVMTAFFFGSVLLAQGQAPAAVGMARSVNGAKAETCRIMGMVVKLADGAPLKNATVQLENAEAHEHTIAASTTADGRYELRNVPPGRYKVRVTRNGYVEMEYGQLKPSDPGATLDLSPGETKDPINFRLIPAGVIAGKIFDEDGEPMWHAAVRPLRHTYRDGGGAVRGEYLNSATTNDLGEYRLYGLAPGRYSVSVVKRDWNEVIGDREFLVEDKQGEKGYIKTYYPGTQDLAKASLITVKEGEEVSGIDIQLRRVSVYRVRGRLINQIKHKGETELLSLTGRTNGVVGQGGLKSSDGSFEFRNVVQGSYLLWAFWDDQGKQYGAHEKIEIGESDVEGVTLVIGTGVTIPGRILWDGKPSLERDELTVSVQSVDAPLSGQGASVEANQEFTLKNVGDGDYKVAVFGPSKDCYIKDTVYGATHSADGVIAVDKGGGEHLEITISSRGARVEGAVVDKDGFPSPRVWVVAVPEEVKRTNLRLFRAQTTDPYGKFQLRGLAPGAYKLFSWTRIENNAWEDGDFLKPFEEKGQAIELSEGDAKTAILTVIETNAE